MITKERDIYETCVLDFEFSTHGGRVVPISYVARVQDDHPLDHKAYWQQVWMPEKGSTPPYSVGDDNVVITFFGEAEMWLIDYLGWPMPKNHFDCFVEHRNLFNGLLPKGKGHWDLDSVAQKFNIQTNYKATDKTNLRQRLGTGDFKYSEKEDILRYNRLDVEATWQVYQKLLTMIKDDPTLDDDRYLRQALLRGRQVNAIGKMINTGLPVDQKSTELITKNMESITEHFINRANKDLGIWDGTRLSMEKFGKMLEQEGLIYSWPRTMTGALKTTKETIRDFADNPKIFQFQTVQSFRKATALSDVPLNENTGRASTYLSMFNNITGRAAPATSKYLPNMSGAFRPLIQAVEGCVIVERDWEQQEFLIAAALSGDEEMLDAYNSGDPYLALGIKAGAIPMGATKKHPKRDIFKTVCLSVQYGQGARGIANKLRCSVDEAQLFMSMHKRIFHKYWEWAQGNLDHALASLKMETKFGWQYQIKLGATPRSFEDKDGFSLNTLRNWPCQAAGCEMLRLALMYASENGLEVVATVHDCLIIHCHIDDLELKDKILVDCMNKASMDVINMITRTEKKEFIYPARFQPKDPRFLEIYNQMLEVAAGNG